MSIFDINNPNSRFVDGVTPLNAVNLNQIVNQIREIGSVYVHQVNFDVRGTDVGYLFNGQWIRFPDIRSDFTTRNDRLTGTLVLVSGQASPVGDGAINLNNGWFDPRNMGCFEEGENFDSYTGSWIGRGGHVGFINFLRTHLVTTQFASRPSAREGHYPMSGSVIRNGRLYNVLGLHRRQGTNQLFIDYQLPAAVATSPVLRQEILYNDFISEYRIRRLA